jgi:hypothetical protein
MTYEPVIIGFDVREMYLPIEVCWPDERRNSYLLSKDVEKPLSTDRIVWPSIFRSHITIVGGIDMPETPNIKIPDQQKTMHNLWIDLREMRSYVAGKSESFPKPCWIIALTELMNKQEKHQWLHPPPPFLTYPFVPTEVDSEWLLLGYDVSQENLWSGLSNERYEPEEIQPLKERWVPHLNKYHLFTDQEQAYQFAAWADNRDRHAPYSKWTVFDTAPSREILTDHFPILIFLLQSIFPAAHH